MKCIICFNDTEINNNFDNWKCNNTHPYIVCNNCVIKLIETNNNCPLCRAKKKKKNELNIYIAELKTNINLINDIIQNIKLNEYDRIIG